MTTVLFILFVAAAMIFVGWPFFRPSEEEASGEAADVSPLERQKLDALAAIKEAEFDLRMGKLSDADFATQSDKFRRQALAAIGAIEEARRTGKRERATTGGNRRPGRVAFCPVCGAGVQARARFCGTCGRSLNEAVA